MTVREAAKLIGCSHQVVYRLCQNHQLGHRRIGVGERKIDITPAHVQEYLDAREVHADPTPITQEAPCPRPRRAPRVLVPDYIGEFLSRSKKYGNGRDRVAERNSGGGRSTRK